MFVVDILSDGQHFSGEKRTRAFDVLKLKMFIEALDQAENWNSTHQGVLAKKLSLSILPSESLTLSL